MLSSLLWVVIGIFNLPTWALEHAREPYTCQAFESWHYDLPQTYVLEIGVCKLETTHSSVVNGEYIGSSEFTLIGTAITYREPLPANSVLLFNTTTPSSISP